MIVKFNVDHEVQGRVYLAGQSHDFDSEMARALTMSGVASEPKTESVTPETSEQEQGEVKQVTTETKPTKKKSK